MEYPNQNKHAFNAQAFAVRRGTLSRAEENADAEKYREGESYEEWLAGENAAALADEG